MVRTVLLQEPPKEDLTVSEKFQLVLDVAQKAQVEHGLIILPESQMVKWHQLMQC